MKAYRPCGHDPLAVVWNNDARRYDCQDCMLSRPPEAAPEPPIPEEPTPDPEPEPEPPVAQPRITLAPKLSEATRTGPGAHRRNDYRKLYREQAEERPAVRRWLWPEQRGLTYYWLDDTGWHEESGSVAFLCEVVAVQLQTATRESLELWRQPIGNTWWLGEPLPPRSHTPWAILRKLARGVAVLFERLP